MIRAIVLYVMNNLRQSIVCRRVLLFLIIALILLALSKATLPFRYWSIIWGTIILVAGSSVITEEWKTGKRLRAVFFPIAIATGGLLTTQGWNSWTTFHNDQTLIRSLVAEWYVNDRSINVIATIRNTMLRSEYKKYNSFPRLDSAQLQRAIGSNLFDDSTASDDSFFVALLMYKLRMSEVNEGLDSLRTVYASSLNPEMKKVIFNFVFAEGAKFDGLLEYHRSIETMLRQKSSWAFDDVDKLHAKLKSKYGPDPNFLVESNE